MKSLIKILEYKVNKYKKYDPETWKKMGGTYAVLDCAISRLTVGASLEQYVALDFWRKSMRERTKYLTYRYDKKIYRYVKQHTTPEQFWRIGNKLQFNRFFSDYIHRDYLYAAEADEETVKAFIDTHGAVMAKKLENTQGKGIMRVSRENISHELLEKLISEKYLLEEVIVQHHEIAKINESSVNTVRIATAIDSQMHAHIIGACLRCGAPGSFVDNYHSGGIVFPIDTDLGIVINSGMPYCSIEHLNVHPGSGMAMIGFKIPNWNKLKNQVIKAAEMIPEMMYIGWDIAVTEEGVDFVEGNIGQDSTVIQLDHRGKLDMIRRILPIRL